MYATVLLAPPPRPHRHTPSKPNISLPQELTRLKGINFLKATNDEELSGAFQEITMSLKRETNHIRRSLVKFILERLDPSMFNIFIESSLAEEIVSSLPSITEKDSAHESKKEFDERIAAFLSMNIKPFMRFLNAPVVVKFQKFIIQKKYEKSMRLLCSIVATKRFTVWVKSSERDALSLEIILESVYPAPMGELPELLIAEIARCLVASSLLLDTLQDCNLSNCCCLLVKCISRVLKYAPMAFATPSTIYCLQQVKTPGVIASPLSDVRNHPEFVQIEQVLQLIKFSLHATIVSKKPDLINIAAICDACKSEVLVHHRDLFEKDEKSLAFLQHSLSSEIVAPYAQYPEKYFPNNLVDLSVFIRSKLDDNIKTKTFTSGVSKMLYMVYHSLKSLPKTPFDAPTLIAAARVMSDLLRFESLRFDLYKNKYPGHEAISPHFIAISCQVADSLVNSPLYPRIPSNNPMAFQIQGSLEELAAGIVIRPREFLQYIIATPPTPGRVQLLSSTLKLIADNSPFLKTGPQLIKLWNEYLVANMVQVTQYGLSILKIPSEITCEIAANFYINIVNASIKMNVGRYVLHPLLNAPLELLSAFGEIAIGIEPINEAKSSLFFLGFFEHIFSSPVIKTYAILLAKGNFWKALKFWLQPEVAVVAGRVTARVLRIFALLSDFSNSMKNGIIESQRLIFDSIHNQIIDDIAEALNNLPECIDLGAQERGLLAMSAMELLLAWCDPVPIAAFVALKVSYDTVLKFKQMGQQAGGYFATICEELAQNILQGFEEGVQNGDSNELANIQNCFTGSDVTQKLYGLFFVLIGLKNKEHAVRK